MSPRFEVLRTDQANDLDIPLFESRPCRLGQLRQRAGWDQGESQLVSGAEQEGVEQCAVVAGGVEVLRQLFEGRSGAFGAQGMLHGVEGGVGRRGRLAGRWGRGRGVTHGWIISSHSPTGRRRRATAGDYWPSALADSWAVAGAPGGTAFTRAAGCFQTEERGIW